MAESSFPQIVIEGDPVDPRECIEPGTGFATFLGYIAAVFGGLLFCLITYGIGVIVLLASVIIAVFTRKKALALIHGSGIQINEQQFPEIYRCVKVLSERLGLSSVPEAYIVEDSVMNAAAVRYGKRNVILLTDDLIHACVSSKTPQSLTFVLGHELGHIAMGHNKTLRLAMSQHYKKLSRLDEFTVDRIGFRLVGKKESVVQGLLVLTVGHKLLPFVNAEALKQQISEVASNKYTAKAEKPLSHPLLLNRIDHVLREQTA